MKKKFFVAFMTICTLIMATGIINTSAASSGTCGDNLTWVLDDEGTLTISGTGDMTSFPSSYQFTGNKSPWYSKRDNIKSVIIEEDVTSIGSYAFHNCENLQIIEIPCSITEIKGNAFESCSGLIAVHISDLANWCKIKFYNSKSNPLCYAKKLYLNGELITNLIIPDNITKIEPYAFADCEELKNLTIPDSVTEMGVFAFSYCTGLESVTLSNNLTEIAAQAFEHCYNLSSITIPDGVTRIGGSAFQYCYSLSSITIPNSVMSIGSDAVCHTNSQLVIYYNGNSDMWDGIKKGIPQNTSGDIDGVGRIYFWYVTIYDENGDIYSKEKNKPYSVVDLSNFTKKDGYELMLYNDKECTDKFDIDTRIIYNTELYYRYEKKIYRISVNEYEEKSISTCWNDNYKIEPIKKGDFIFDGYYTQKNGEGIKLTDDEGYSLEGFLFDEDIIAYPYFKDQVLIKGVPAVTVGDNNIKYTVSLYTNKDNIYYSTIYVKYPHSLTLSQKPLTKNFDEVSLDKIIVQEEFNIAEIVCTYSYNNDAIPAETAIEIFDLYFDFAENIEPNNVIIEITQDSILMNENDYAFDKILNQTVAVNSKYIQSIVINGPSSTGIPIQYTATVLPITISDKSVVWTVSDETIATISDDGVLTPIKDGFVVITATAKDGSGVYGTIEVEIIFTYAKVDSITTDGSWAEKFENGKTEYVVYVGENETSFNVSATYTKGTLKVNGSTLISGRTKTVDLTNEKTTITINRTNVDGYTDIIYTLTVIKTQDAFIADIETTDEGYAFDIVLNEDEIDSFETATVIAAIYADNGEFLGFEQVPVTKGTTTLTATVKTDEIPQYAKLMLWDSINGLNPLCNEKEITIQ